MPKRYLGNIITDTPTAPAGPYESDAASGVWSVAEASAYTKAGLWPIAGNFPLSPEDVFSTDLWSGTGATTNTITNGIDISGEGGLVWVHSRSRGGEQHILTDTENGQGKALDSSSTSSLSTTTESVQNLNSDGYSFSGDLSPINRPNDTYVGWTFRKASKFFDVVTYTGNGTSGRTVSHNLGSVPGCIIVKRTDTTGSWRSYHTSLGATKYIDINSTSAAGTSNTSWADTEPTSTEITLGSSVNVNASGGSYVAYLFAHNDGDGDFGPDGDADIIKCGSYTGTGSAGLEIDLGFEPQWFLMKRTDTAGSDWFLFDVMRGFDASGNADRGLRANTSDAESNVGPAFRPIANGVEVQGTFSSVNASGGTYIYMAIRRGPMAVPESATDVFDVAERGADSPPPLYRSGFVTDMFINRADVTLGGNNYVLDRLRGQVQVLMTDASDAEAAYGGAAYGFDVMDGIGNFTGLDSNNYSWMWKRAPNFFDVVAYSGNSTAGRTVSHNLGVAPEMMWVKGRSNSDNWSVYHKDLNVGSGQYLQLNVTQAAGTNSNQFTTTAPTSSVFSLGSDGAVNGSSTTYIAYLFASLDGVSKVGSFTGNGTTINIDCGFSSSARFVMTKRTDAGSDWVVWDTERGIVAGNDGYLVLNDVNEENSSYDSIDTYSSGFSLNYDGVATNISGASYIFYAIA